MFVYYFYCLCAGARTSKELDDFRRGIPRICLIFGKIQLWALLASSSIIGYDMNSNLLTLDDLYWILDEFVLGFYIEEGCDVFDIGHINVFTPDDSRF